MYLAGLYFAALLWAVARNDSVRGGGCHLIYPLGIVFYTSTWWMDLFTFGLW